MLNLDPISPPRTPPTIMKGSILKSKLLKPEAIATVTSFEAWENNIVIIEFTEASFVSMEKNIVRMQTFIGPPPIDKKDAIKPKSKPMDMQAKEFSI